MGINHKKSDELVDDAHSIIDDVDSTKKLKFQVSGVSTGQTRVLTVPDADGSLALSGGTVTFSDITADSLLLNDLTASSITQTDGSKNLTSISDLTSYISGTSNRITSTQSGTGVILSTPQDLHTSATVVFSSVSGFSEGKFNTINEYNTNSGCTVEGVLLKSSSITTVGLQVDTITEKTAANGVSIDSVVCKDNTVDCLQLICSDLLERVADTGINIDLLLNVKDGVISGATQINCDNLRLDGNTLSSTSGNLILSPTSGILEAGTLQFNGSTITETNDNDITISLGSGRVSIDTDQSNCFNIKNINNLQGVDILMSTNNNMTLNMAGDYTMLDTTSGQEIKINNLRPMSDNSQSNGDSGLRWSELYSVNSTINTSDKNLKKDIADCPLGLDFINSLRPVEYKWKDGGKRTHLGLIAQELQSVLGNDADKYSVFIDGSYNEQKRRDLMKSKFDKHENELFAENSNYVKKTFVYSNDDNRNEFLLGVRYTELFAPLIKSIQQQYEINEAQSATILSLNSQINFLEKSFNKKINSELSVIKSRLALLE